MPATSSFSIARFTAYMAWFQAFYKGREGLGWGLGNTYWCLKR